MYNTFWMSQLSRGKWDSLRLKNTGVTLEKVYAKQKTWVEQAKSEVEWMLEVMLEGETANQITMPTIAGFIAILIAWLVFYLSQPRPANIGWLFDLYLCN